MRAEGPFSILERSTDSPGLVFTWGQNDRTRRKLDWALEMARDESRLYGSNTFVVVNGNPVLTLERELNGQLFGLFQNGVSLGQRYFIYAHNHKTGKRTYVGGGTQWPGVEQAAHYRSLKLLSGHIEVLDEVTGNRTTFERGVAMATSRRIAIN